VVELLLAPCEIERAQMNERIVRRFVDASPAFRRAMSFSDSDSTRRSQAGGLTFAVIISGQIGWVGEARSTSITLLR
jgi:hypothetical protein